MSASNKLLLLIGGTSDIGRAVALEYAAAGWEVELTARSPAAAQRNADDLAARTGRSVAVRELDVLQVDRFPQFVGGLPRLPDSVVCVVGELGDQARAESDPGLALQVLRANFEGPALLLESFAGAFKARGSGALVGVSSVAGDRGRASNYFYGAGKAGFTAYLSGLRNRLFRSGVRVITVKPGFVRTRMTSGMKLPPLLTSDPDAVGKAIFRAAERNGSDVIYVGRIWALVMTIIRLIPEPLFKRLRL